MLSNKRNRLFEYQQNSNPSRKKQKMEETSSHARKKSEAITQKIHSFQTIGRDVVLYMFSSFLDLSTIYQTKRINTHLNTIIDNNMNTIMRKVLLFKKKGKTTGSFLNSKDSFLNSKELKFETLHHLGVLKIDILYNYPNNTIFESKYQFLLYKINDGYDLSILNTYFVVCNFTVDINYKILCVHHKRTRFKARNFPNRYESELFKMVGPTICKRNIILRTKRQSILWMNSRFHLDKWTDEFPWEHMHMCGSSVLGALDPSLDESVYPIGDLDFFNLGTIDNREWRGLIDNFMVYMKGCNHKTRLDDCSWINLDMFTRFKCAILFDGLAASNEDNWVYFDFVYVPNATTYPINAFDISLSQASFDGNNFYCSQSFKQSIITNTFTSCVFGGIKKDLEYQMERVYKYVSRGYNLLISKDMKDDEVCKIESILESTNYVKYKLMKYKGCDYIGINRLTLDIYNIHDKFINMI